MERVVEQISWQRLQSVKCGAQPPTFPALRMGQELLHRPLAELHRLPHQARLSFNCCMCVEWAPSQNASPSPNLRLQSCLCIGVSMSYKRSRATYEADLAAQQAPFVLFGTPLPPLDPEVRDDGSYVPLWKQEVRDERGRKRLHGAFTGGWSAG